jgi:hypothetical protein
MMTGVRNGATSGLGQRAIIRKPVSAKGNEGGVVVQGFAEWNAPRQKPSNHFAFAGHYFVRSPQPNAASKRCRVSWSLYPSIFLFFTGGSDE